MRPSTTGRQALPPSRLGAHAEGVITNLNVDPAAIVSKLGFLVRWDLPTRDHDALLAIALRERPTRRHFDPEVVSFWQIGADGRGHQSELTFDATYPLERRIAWGPLVIVDRLGVRNTFLSLGGTLRGERVDPGTVVLALTSTGPILRRGGHSQRYDQLAAELTAFFARLLVPIDFTPGAEARIGREEPIVLYAAFLQHEVPRIASSDLVREMYGTDARLVRAEAERVAARNPAAWSAATTLLSELAIT